MKRSHKLRAMGDVQAVVDRAPDLSAAARELGVDRSTITRWMQRGKLRAKPPAPLREGQAPPPPPTSSDWTGWADAVRHAYTLSETDLQLVGLAEKALGLAYGAESAPLVVLAAMTKFGGLVRQLNLQASASAPAGQPQARVSTRASVRPTADPRAILMAVK